MAAFFTNVLTKFHATRQPPVVALPGSPSVGPRKISIRNRKHQRVVILIDDPGARGTVVIAHGLGCNKNEADMETIARAVRDEGYTAVRFDATNGVGESDGAFRKATVTNYLSDLEDVIAWLNEQEWYRGPLALAGHDIGGLTCALFVAQHPGRVSKLILLAPVVSGALSLEALRRLHNLNAWKTLGTMIWESQSRPGLIRRLDWVHMEDRLRYDATGVGSQLRLPILQIAHEKDKLTPLAHQQMLFNALLREFTTLFMLKNAHHRLHHASHFAKLYEVVRLWLREGRLPALM